MLIKHLPRSTWCYTISWQRFYTILWHKFSHICDVIKQNESELEKYENQVIKCYCMTHSQGYILLKTSSNLNLWIHRSSHFIVLLKQYYTKEIEYWYWPCLNIDISEFRLILLGHITLHCDAHNFRKLKEYYEIVGESRRLSAFFPTHVVFVTEMHFYSWN